MVLRQGVVHIGLGMALGLGIALAIAAVAGNGIQNTLFGVSARDPVTYGLVFAIVTIVSLVATMVPARRATRVDPMIALRAE
jgi:ABC-type antimicrobial peptide transport system permease subunit